MIDFQRSPALKEGCVGLSRRRLVVVTAGVALRIGVDPDSWLCSVSFDICVHGGLTGWGRVTTLQFAMTRRGFKATLGKREKSEDAQDSF